MNTYLFRRSKKRFPRKVIAEARTYTHIHIRYIPYTYASPCIREGVPLSPRIPNAGSLERAEIRQKKHDDMGLRDNSTHLIYDNSSQIALSLSSLHDITSPSLARRSHDHITSSLKAHFISSPSARLV